MFTCTPCSQECGGHPECPECGDEAQSKMAMLLEIEPQYWYIHRHVIRLNYGGPEEGGWHFKSGYADDEWTPALHAFETEDEAIAECYHLNMCERDRQKREEDYEFTSVVAYRSTHYEYDVNSSPVPYDFPQERPYYS